MSLLVTIAPWFRELIVDPLGNGPIVDDCEVRVGLSAKLWQGSEAWSGQVAERDAQTDCRQEVEGVRGVDEAIALPGRVLDLGGHQGRLRAFLKSHQEYVSCDPFLDLFAGLDRQPNLLSPTRA